MAPWLICPSRRGAPRMRLFCFPHAGGGASAFHGWSQRLGPDVEVHAVQLPGREGRLAEAPLGRLRDLVGGLAPALLEHLDRPFAFFGHSMGALLAFESARWLRRNGFPAPSQLFASGHRAPDSPSPHTPLHGLPDGDFMAQIRLRYGGIPEPLLANADLLALVLPALRADVMAVETYRYDPEPPLDCPMWAFGGVDDPEAVRRDLEAWRPHTSGAFALELFPGDHFYLRTQETLALTTVSRILGTTLGGVR